MHSITIPSLGAHASKRFSKQELYEELAWFMPAFARGVERMYGTGAAVLLRSADVVPYKPSLQELQSTPLWQSLSQLYDYGVEGVLPSINGLGDGSLADVEMFVMGLDGLTLYLNEDEGGIPKLSRQTVALAQARLILDGGEPYTNLDTERPSDHLALAQIALLADMDESSVRRLASLERLHSLETADFGKPTYIHIDEAKRWLEGCEGFVPTGTKKATAFNFAKTFKMELPVDVIRALNERAAASGMTPFQVLRNVFAKEISHDPLYGTNTLVAPANERGDSNQEDA